MSERFIALNGTVLLRQSGVFSEHQLYRNSENHVFARKGNGYVRLTQHNTTSVARLFWSEMQLYGETQVIGGRLCFVPIQTKARRKAA